MRHDALNYSEHLVSSLFDSDRKMLDKDIAGILQWTLLSAVFSYEYGINIVAIPFMIAF